MMLEAFEQTIPHNFPCSEKGLTLGTKTGGIGSGVNQEEVKR